MPDSNHVPNFPTLGLFVFKWVCRPSIFSVEGVEVRVIVIDSDQPSMVRESDRLIEGEQSDRGRRG